MDKVRLLARSRAFFTADVELEAYGRVMLVGDKDAVERVLIVLSEHEGHELKLLQDE